MRQETVEVANILISEIEHYRRMIDNINNRLREVGNSPRTHVTIDCGLSLKKEYYVTALTAELSDTKTNLRSVQSSLSKLKDTKPKKVKK